MAIDSRDARACAELLRQGSKSFHAAGLLLPSRMREPVAALYAFCRVSDDAIDECVGDVNVALDGLHERLDRIYARRPRAYAVDRAFAEVVREYKIPKAIPLALLEGYAWDAASKRYETFDDLCDYAARVASTVGLMMTLVMGERRHDVLARAADLGLAMQLTNIARDVGEDARNGRIYLPISWLRRANLSADDLLTMAAPPPALRHLVRELLAHADALYARAEAGITELPRDCRVAISGARHIYAEIGKEISAHDYDSITQRARTSGQRKAELLLWSLPRALVPFSGRVNAPAHKATAFLIDAVDRNEPLQ